MPIQWEWLDKKIVSAYNYLVKNFDYESFDYFSLSASSGFGEGNDILGGRVRLDRTNVLHVTTGKRIYLKGASRDEYTGKNWTCGIHNFIPAGNNYGNVYDDYLEMKHCMKILAGNDKFLRNISIPIPLLSLSLIYGQNQYSYHPEFMNSNRNQAFFPGLSATPATSLLKNGCQKALVIH